MLVAAALISGAIRTVTVLVIVEAGSISVVIADMIADIIAVARD